VREVRVPVDEKRASSDGATVSAAAAAGATGAPVPGPAGTSTILPSIDTIVRRRYAANPIPREPYSSIFIMKTQI